MAANKVHWLVVRLDTRGSAPTLTAMLTEDDTRRALRFDRMASALEWLNKHPKQQEGVKLLPLEIRG